MKFVAKVLAVVASFAYANAATCTCSMTIDNYVHEVYVDGVDKSSSTSNLGTGLYTVKTLSFECGPETRLAVKGSDNEAGCVNGGFAMSCTSTDTSSQWHGFKTGQGSSEVKVYNYASNTPTGWEQPSFDDSSWSFASQSSGGNTGAVAGCSSTDCSICGTGNKWLFRLPPLGTGKCSCTFTIDNYASEIYINGVNYASHTANMNAGWDAQRSLSFQCSDDTVLALKGGDHESGCETGGMSMYCTSTDIASPWNGYTTGLDAGIKVSDANAGTPANWYDTDFDDSTWSDVTSAKGREVSGSGCSANGDCHVALCGTNQWFFRLTPLPFLALECPCGTNQGGSLIANNDVSGLGMTTDAERATLATTAEGCRDACRSLSGCLSFSWTDRDANYPGQFTCSLYDAAAASSSWTVQVFCTLTDDQCATHDQLVQTLRATGCVDAEDSVNTDYWQTQSDSSVFADMHSYCTLNRDGTAATYQKDNCCGVGNSCTPTCSLQTAFATDAPTASPTASPTGSPTTAEALANEQTKEALASSSWKTGQVGDTVYIQNEITQNTFSNSNGQRNEWTYVDVATAHALDSSIFDNHLDHSVTDGSFEVATTGVTFTDSAGTTTFPWECTCSN